MNIEIANRLVELRKKNNLSQEELANKLGLSRQAISKWERAESSPDTDNLICLARLYNISLDELLKTEATNDEIIDDNLDSNMDDFRMDNGGIHIKRANKEVYIGLKGIHVKEPNREVHLGGDGVIFNSDNDDKLTIITRKRKRIGEIMKSAIILASIIAYIIYGVVLKVWHPSWIILFIGLVLSELVNDIVYKMWMGGFLPLLIVAIYLVLGFYFSMWHPGWVVFLFIPLYYLIVPKNKGVKILNS